MQIPCPLDAYDWLTHFDSLRWQRGEQYAYLSLLDPSGRRIKQDIKGYFRSKQDADAYFNSVLNLTQCTEYRRGYPDMTNKKLSPIEQETRIYRAFVSFIQYPEGKPVAKQCYKPVMTVTAA